MLTSRRRKNFGWLWLFNGAGNSGDVDSSGGGGGGGSPDTVDSSGTSDSGANGNDNSVSGIVDATEINLDEAFSDKDTGSKSKVDWADAIPSELKDKGYIQNILKSEDPTKQLFQEFDHLQKKLGERVEGVPKEGASQEEWDKFYNALGRPEKADDYEIAAPEWSDEDKEIGKYIDSFRGNDEYFKDIKEMFHKRGLTKEQAKGLSQDFDAINLKHNKAAFEEAAKIQAEWGQNYVEQMQDLFGQRANAVHEVGTKLLKDNLPDKVKGMVDTLDGRSMAILTAALDSINTKYIKPDGKFQTRDSRGANTEDVRSEGRKLMAHPAYLDTSHPDHERIKEQVRVHYETNIV